MFRLEGVSSRSYLRGGLSKKNDPHNKLAEMKTGQVDLFFLNCRSFMKMTEDALLDRFIPLLLRKRTLQSSCA